LATGLCQLGCRQILYLGKLGALTRPEDVYTRIFCPSKFFVVNYRQVDFEVPPIENAILMAYPELDTGCHISVPTVLEEDYLQRELARKLQAQSIDNEIAVIARAVYRYSQQMSKKVTFSALHIATDYLRTVTERTLPTPADLFKVPKERKKERVDYMITHILLPYLRLIP
jgi:hypothetical protein